MTLRSAVVFALLVGCLLGAIVAFSAPAAAGSIELENELSQSSTDRIEVETRLSIPDSMVDLEVTLPDGADVYERDGFRRVGDRYEWTKETSEPSLKYEYEGTVYGARGDREGHLFVVADEWALVRTPNVDLSGNTTDPDTETTRENTVDGEGVTSTHIAYLGPYTEHTESTGGQTFRLIVPDASELHEDPNDILDAFEVAVGRLAIGEPTDEVFAVAAPTAEHTWAPAGLQRGNGGDMWVRDTERLGTDSDTWIHEYVHTRQRYASTDATRWTIEGMADYYAALLPYEAGDITYREFEARLEKGTVAEYDDVRLTDPGTWTGTDADYDRGALVFARLDWRLRADADTTLDAVIAGVNDPDRELTQRRLLEAIEAAGGAELRAEFERYTETTDVVPIATQSEHVDAFGGPDVRYAVEGTAVSGPYRSGVDPSELVVGETLELRVAAENVGSDAGSFEVAFDLDGDRIAVETGRLEPGASTTLTFDHTFDSPGEFEVAIAGNRLPIAVAAPADIEVTGIDFEPSDPSPGESVTIRATVASAADRPAAGEVTFAIDGEEIAVESVRIDEEGVVRTTHAFEAPGEYVVSVGGQSTTVVVGEADTPVAIDDQSGFTPAVALLALVVALIASRRR